MLPRINLSDPKDDHHMIIVEDGERVLNPSETKLYDKQHPQARREPMHAEVSGSKMPMYDAGGVSAAPDISNLTTSRDSSGPDMNVTPVPAAPDLANLTTSRDSNGPNMDVTPKGPSFWKKVEENVKSKAAKPSPMLPGQTMVDIHDTPQMDQEVFDKGGEEVKSSPSVTDQIKARAAELYKQAKQAPADYGAEAEGYKQRQQNINQYNAAVAPAAPQMRSYAPVEADKINPAGKYGMRTGEQRLNAQGDVINPTTPQGMGAGRPQLPVPTELYDDGGEHGGESEAPTDDDKLKAAALEQAQAEVTGAPVDTAGPVIPNPKGIKVSDDTERPMAEPQKAQMSIGNAPLMRPTMNTQNATPQGPITSEASTGKANPMVSPASTRMPEAAMRSGATDTTTLPNHGPEPRNSVNGSELPVSSEERVDKVKAATPKMISPEMQAVHQDADDAMKSGDTVKLGMAALNARMLKQGEAGRAPVPLPTPTAPTARENVLNQEKELRYKMINGATEQIRFQAEKDLAELRRRTPWGSEGSAHPGMGGKIAHGISSIAQGLAREAVPYALPYIPGSQANLAASEARGEQGVEQAQEKEQKAATTAVEQGKPELQQEAQRITEEKNQMANQAALLAKGYQKDAAGKAAPLAYEEMSPHDQGLYDLNQAKANAQNAIAELKQAQADPQSPQSQLILARAKAEGERMDQAGQKIGLDVDRYKAEYLGVDHDNNPLAGVQTTPEGKPVGTKVGAGVKGAKPTANQSQKADLAENVVHNIDEATKLIRSHPDLFGKVSGRFTSAAQMIGSNDPAIAQLGTIIRNTAMATNGIHGLRSAQAIEGTEHELLNKFRNGPEATISALKENRRSVGDFLKDGGKPLIPDPDLIPRGASAEVLDKDGNVTGHVVNNKYVALPK